MAPRTKPSSVTEYHVVHVTDPETRWEVQYEKERFGYPAWDKRIAISAAKQLAEQNPPGKVIVHGRGGEVEREILVEEHTSTKRRKS
jgi:hypothetical protein